MLGKWKWTGFWIGILHIMLYAIVHICYYNKICADDGQVQSNLHSDITEGTYCKIVGHSIICHIRGAVA